MAAPGPGYVKTRGDSGVGRGAVGAVHMQPGAQPVSASAGASMCMRCIGAFSHGLPAAQEERGLASTEERAARAPSAV